MDTQYLAYYTVLGVAHHRAYVVITKSVKSRLAIRNMLNDRFNTLGKKEKETVQTALNKVSKNISKKCSF